MHTDQNAAVRLKSLEALSESAGAPDQVRQTLLDALVNDQNPGVRIEAMNSLRDLAEKRPIESDRQMLDILRARMQKDPTLYPLAERSYIARPRALLRNSSDESLTTSSGAPPRANRNGSARASRHRFIDLCCGAVSCVLAPSASLARRQGSSQAQHAARDISDVRGSQRTRDGERTRVNLDLGNVIVRTQDIGRIDYTVHLEADGRGEDAKQLLKSYA